MEPIRSIYVIFAKALAAFAESIGLIRFLERNRHVRACLYLRSLFSIYDAEDLARLDLPWWTFGAIDYLDTVLRARGRQITVFEYGAGASTLWLARRCRAVYSAGHDPAWGRQARLLCSQHKNVTIAVIPAAPCDAETRHTSERSGWSGLSFDRYVESIRTHPFNFDLIVIDGRCRAACLAEAQRKLNAGGIIVFDNSNRRRYRTAIQSSPLRRTVFRGLVPSLPFPGETTVIHAEASSGETTDAVMRDIRR